MRFKLDEHFDARIVALVAEGGHDVETLVVVVRPPRNVLPMIRSTLESALPDLKSRSLKGRLWIVEPGRIRVYDPQEEP